MVFAHTGVVIKGFCCPSGSGKQGRSQCHPPVTMRFGVENVYFYRKREFVDQTGPFWQWFALVQPEKVIETTNVRFSNEKQWFLSHTGMVIKVFCGPNGVVTMRPARGAHPVTMRF